MSTQYLVNLFTYSKLDLKMLCKGRINVVKRVFVIKIRHG